MLDLATATNEELLAAIIDEVQAFEALGEAKRSIGEALDTLEAIKQILEGAFLLD